MAALRKIDTMDNGEAVKAWWVSVRRSLTIYLNLIERSPSLNMDDPRKIASELQWNYSQVQHMNIPTCIDSVYDHLSQSLLNLYMAYEVLTVSEFVQSDIYYGRAFAEFNLVRSTLMRAGVVEIL